METQVEVLSLVGDIAAKNGAPKTHAHVVLGKDDGAAIDGHFSALTFGPPRSSADRIAESSLPSNR